MSAEPLASVAPGGTSPLVLACASLASCDGEELESGKGGCLCGCASEYNGPTGCSVVGCGRMGMGSVLVWGIGSGVGQGKELAEVWLQVSSASRAVGVE